MVDDLYWLFSTIAQTLAAIVALVGMLAVYRLQIISNSKNQIMNASEKSRIYFHGTPAMSQTPESFVSDWRNYRKNSDNPELDGIVSQLENLIKTDKKIKSDFKPFLFVNLGTILGSLFAIPFLESLFCEKLLVIVLTIAIVGVCFYLTIKLTLSLLSPKE